MIDRRLNESEAEEREYLEYVKRKIVVEIDKVGKKVDSRHAEMLDLKDYLQENKAEMDHVEKASVRQSVELMSTIGEQSAARKMRLNKLLESPYFGRIDIGAEPDQPVRPTYIGIHSLYDDDIEAHLVHDWRAPISSMFYEFELGDAYYDAPDGRIACGLMRKRQYRIERQRLVFMIESSLNIQDDILQEELSRASDEKMRNIVATIQRDQNAIIRNDQSHTLIIQGAAGSGKTSIALHRIAFLLYKYKDSIRSDEILIISPNKVFAHYISQVLPELGEEMIQETTMESLAADLLDDNIRFQTFSEQVSNLLTRRDEKYANRIKFKATSQFLRKLEEYARHVRNSKINASDLKIGPITLEAAWIAARFRSCARRSGRDPITEVLNDIVEHLRDHHQKHITGKERTGLRSDLKRMFTSPTLTALYKMFYDWLDVPHMFKRSAGKYEYSDVFPLIYLRMMIDGSSAMADVKHVVIDEMQDYTPVQYEVIANLFPCKKTILGDYNQSVNPLSSSTAESIGKILPESECMYMHKSYRSTIEITALAQSIHRNPHLIPIERHGERPEVIQCDDARQEIEQIREAIRVFLNSSQLRASFARRRNRPTGCMRDCRATTCRYAGSMHKVRSSATVS